MSAHDLALFIFSLFMCAQYACAQDVKAPASMENAVQQTSLFRTLPADARLADDKTALVRAANPADLNGPPVPSVSDAQLTGRAGITQSANGQDLYTRVTKEYYSQSTTLAAKKENPDTLSRFGLRYSPTGNDRIWLEYRFSEKGAIRLRGAAHRGVRVMAVFEY